MLIAKAEVNIWELHAGNYIYGALTSLVRLERLRPFTEASSRQCGLLMWICQCGYAACCVLWARDLSFTI